VTSTPDNQRRVVITGMGFVTPLGDDVDAVWARLLAGESAIQPVTRFDAAAFATNFAAQSADPDLCSLYECAARFADAGLNSRLALAAAAKAIRSAGFGDPADAAFPIGRACAAAMGVEPGRFGVYLGSGEGVPDTANLFAANIAGWSDEAGAIDDRAWAGAAHALLDPVREIEQEPDAVIQHLAGVFGCMGPVSNCMTACAASTQALGEAVNVLRAGEADMMLAGGSHSMIHPLGMTGFIRLTALSRRCDDPITAARPFDRTRDGFVMGDGAGMLVLETLERAQSRNAKPLAEVAGFGSSADAYRITDIEPAGKGAAAAMRACLQDAGLDPAVVDESGRPPVHYISAHGTGTKENDTIESRAVHAVFGERARDVPFSSVKSMLGHLIQAAGAVELITCIKAIETGWIPPTINLHDPDPECDLDYVPNEARDLNPTGGVQVAMSNSFGFGGQNDTMLIKQFTP